MIGAYAWWQWLMYFYIYCFAGWIWESAYVSVKKRRFVNRGFLHIPMLPLYGSGAVTVLFVTLPFKDHLILLYLAGMVGATFLEMVTGLTMESLYKVKYWDYSKNFLNFKGVICLKASLLWGVFSVAMVRFVQEPVAGLLSGIPQPAVYAAEAVVTAAFVTDFYVSNRQALQLAHIITAMEKAKEEMQADLLRMEEDLAEQRRLLEERLAEARERAEDQAVELIQEAVNRTEEARQAAAENRRRMAETAELRREEARNKLSEMKYERNLKVEEARAKLSEMKDERNLKVEEARAKLSEMKDERDLKMAEVRRVPEHMLEEARLNVLFHNEEVLRNYQNRREEYLRRQDELLEQAGILSRGMLLRNPTAGISQHGEISGLLREKAESWLSMKKARNRDSVN